MLLSIKNLHASVEAKSILKGVNLDIESTHTHVIMGPNGSGKSTLSNVLMGHPDFSIEKGSIKFKSKNLIKLKPHERSLNGLFLAFQYPRAISGVTLEEFLLAAYRSKQAFLHPKKPPILVFHFKRLLKEVMDSLDIPERFANRYLNVGFSGGEKKKVEILQMALLQPDLAILDETDSGLDVDALKVVSNGINLLKNQNPNLSLIIITHYERILNYLKPNFVHVMKDGLIVKSGDHKFAKELESKGYSHI